MEANVVFVYCIHKHSIINMCCSLESVFKEVYFVFQVFILNSALHCLVIVLHIEHVN